jgi:hypothetical protein
MLVVKSEGKRPLGRTKHRWEDNIKINIKETGLRYLGWIYLAQDGI